MQGPTIRPPTVLSSAPLARRELQAEKETQVTGAKWPLATASCLPVRASQMRTVFCMSADPVASCAQVTTWNM